MLFILLTGVLGVLAAMHFALRARRQSLGFIRGMVLATLFGTLAASCADVGATLDTAEKSFSEVPSEAEALPRALHIVIEGLAESTSPGILGFSFLGLTSMLVAVGRRRLDERTGGEPAANSPARAVTG